MLAWVTSGLIAPGVQCGSGSEFRPEPRAWQEPGGGWGWTTALLAALTGSRPPLRTALLTPSAAAGLEAGGATLLDAPPQPASRTRQIRLMRRIQPTLSPAPGVALPTRPCSGGR